jgi:hypothetical protein
MSSLMLTFAFFLPDTQPGIFFLGGRREMCTSHYSVQTEKMSLEEGDGMVSVGLLE